MFVPYLQYTHEQVLKLYSPVEAYCPDCAQFHKTYKKTAGHSDFPIALCDECEENWEAFLAEHGTPISKGLPTLPNQGETK